MCCSRPSVKRSDFLSRSQIQILEPWSREGKKHTHISVWVHSHVYTQGDNKTCFHLRIHMPKYTLFHTYSTHTLCTKGWDSYPRTCRKFLSKTHAHMPESTIWELERAEGLVGLGKKRYFKPWRVLITDHDVPRLSWPQLPSWLLSQDQNAQFLNNM